LEGAKQLSANSPPPHLHEPQFASGSFSVQGADQPEAPNRKGESVMKSKKTLVLAASIFALTLSAFPHHAAASSTTAPTSSDTSAIRKAGGSNLIYLQYVQVELLTGILSSALLP
jgi:hypothetical protein